MSTPFAGPSKDAGLSSQSPSSDDALRYESFSDETFDVANATLPKEPPFSGDFHATIPLEDGSLGVVMGDVVGHGEAAAAHADTLCTAISGCLAEGLEPSEALGFVNAAAEMSPEFEGFATVFVGTINPQTGVLVYSSGGHEPALIADSSAEDAENRANAANTRGASDVEELGTTGPPLGVLGAESVHYGSRSVNLKKGGTLLLYTDGITEARRGSEMLGSERLRRVFSHYRDLAPPRLARKVMNYARAFTGKGKKLRDDAALLIVRRRKLRKE